MSLYMYFRIDMFHNTTIIQYKSLVLQRQETNTLLYKHV